jgi:crotonobetainyl-CoA:carnitine CoA-transferase CaiB-like acyl-CoA transferase
MFKKLKVVELASVLAGPAVGMFFAELGAKVIKVENKKVGGDVTRTWKTSQEDAHPVSAYFSSVNYAKTYVSLDISDARDYQKLIKLISTADVVISNFKTASAKKLKVDFATLKKINPTLIYAQLNGFNDANRVAFDVVLQAETGFMYMNGQADSEPTKMPVALIDVLAAHQLKEGILCALLKREQTKKGSLVECSLEEAAIASLVNQATNYLMNNSVPQRMGSLHPNIAPYGEIVYTKDKKALVLAAGNDKQFQDLCLLLGIEKIALQNKFLHNQNRVENRDELHIILSNAFLKKTIKEIYPKLLKHNVPVGAIKNLKEVFETKTAQQMILEETIEGKKTKRVKTVAFKVS